MINNSLNENVSGEPVNAKVYDANRVAVAWAGVAFLLLVIGVLFAVNIPGAPLYGDGKRFARWVEVTVPLLFLLFIVPGVVYGIKAKNHPKQ